MRIREFKLKKLQSNDRILNLYYRTGRIVRDREKKNILYYIIFAKANQYMYIRTYVNRICYNIINSNIDARTYVRDFEYVNTSRTLVIFRVQRKNHF